jgi:predicted transposase/invertase (TIGR01784 family)
MLLDPKLDLVFKKLFCLPENLPALLKFLNLIFADRGMPLVDDITIQNPQIDGDSLKDKSIALDIHAKSALGESLNIEIQLRSHAGLAERILYYWSRQYGSQLQAGEDYNRLRRTVSIFLLDFDLTLQGKMHSVYGVLEKERYEPLTEQLEIHLLELPKLKWDGQQQLNMLHNWLHFLRGATIEEWIRMSKDDDELRKVMSTLESISKDREMWLLAESRKKWLHDQAAFRATGYEEGKAEGKAVGLAEGKAEGLAEGKAEGKAEGLEEGLQLKNRELAIGMLNEGVSVDIIKKLTGYSAEELSPFRR